MLALSSGGLDRSPPVHSHTDPGRREAVRFKRLPKGLPIRWPVFFGGALDDDREITRGHEGRLREFHTGPSTALAALIPGKLRVRLPTIDIGFRAPGIRSRRMSTIDPVNITVGTDSFQMARGASGNDQGVEATPTPVPRSQHCAAAEPHVPRSNPARWHNRHPDRVRLSSDEWVRKSFALNRADGMPCPSMRNGARGFRSPRNSAETLGRIAFRLSFLAGSQQASRIYIVPVRPVRT
jgi:hypothetical protein